MSPDLNDVDLERQLRRRAESAHSGTDWARFELLPSVRSGLGNGVERVPSSRLAPLGGIAAIAAVLVLLVVALPRFVPGPAGSPTAVSGLNDPSPTSLAEPTSGPIASPPEPDLASKTVPCPYEGGDAETAEVAITDHAGLVLDCVTSTPGTDRPSKDPGSGASVSNPDRNTSQLEVFWMEPALCDTLAELELMRVEGGYMLVVDSLPGEQTRICRLPSHSYHGVTLQLATPIAADDVQALLLHSGRNESMAETTGGRFYLTIGSGSREYSAGTAIAVDAELGYSDGPDTLRANTQLGFGFEQLDGDLEMAPVWPDICMPQELHRDDPLRVPYQKSGGYSPAAPNADFYRRYLEDPDLRLPPGIWRVYAVANLIVGDDCSGQSLSLTASVIVRTTGAPTSPSPTTEPTASPELPPSPTPAEPPTLEPSTSRTFDCEGAPNGDVAGAMTLVDHSSLVGGCSVPDPIDGDPAPIPTSDPRVLTYEWTIPCVADVSSTVLDFWSRNDVTTGSSRAPYLLIATRSEPKPGSGCLDAIGLRVVQVVFNEPIAMTDVQFVLIDEGGGGGRDVEEFDWGYFGLNLTSENAEYAAGEPIEINAELLYDGIEPTLMLSGVTTLVNGFGIEQLDGPLVMGPAWEEPCLRHEIRSAEPLLFPYVKSAGWSQDDPNAEFFQEWVRDPQLRLPAGTWLVTAYSEFAIGSECAGAQVDLEASIVIHVR